MARLAKEPFAYEVIREGDSITVVISCEAYTRVPSLEDDPHTMSKTCDILNEVGAATKIVYYQRRNIEYDYEQVQMISEIADFYKHVTKNNSLSYGAMSVDKDCEKYVVSWYTKLKHVLSHTLRSDPIGCYVELRRLIREEQIAMDRARDLHMQKCQRGYISHLNSLIQKLGQCKLIARSEGHLAGFKPGDREIYRNYFHPTIKPDFLFTKLMGKFPDEGDELDSYMVGDTEVTVFEIPDTIQYLYHMTPPEFQLNEDKYEILDSARKIMTEHQPKKEEFVDPERMRHVFLHIGRDLIEELCEVKKFRLKDEEIDELAAILVRYTVGFGMVENLLADEKVQDISINSPMGELPIFITHAEWGDCRTNIMPSKTDSESWASKLRMLSGRPLDAANPILDTEVELPGASARTSTIIDPLSPEGLSFSFRRHRDKPWTLPLFIKNRMINGLAAGLLSFLIDGTRTFFICGTRGSGKSSFLSGCMLEIMRRNRIITIEDTLELPFNSFKNLGFNIVQMKVASALAHESNEFTATDGIRSTLRLGDSSLFVGEVRSTEAIALFEAMRVGAGANVVGGTFHADSPYGVFDRCVNAIGIPATSFKALDVNVIANPIRSADGLHMWRRITQITEVRKFWQKDPQEENGFSDLLKYDSQSDELQPSNDLLNGDSDVLKSIAAGVKDWAGNWDAVWDNIQLRAKIKDTIVALSDKAKDLSLLEAPFVISCNDEFHRISDSVREEVGALDSKRIFFEWNEWAKRRVKHIEHERNQ